VHPNVVQVFRFGRLPDGTPYLVMRFVKGRTMEERLQAEGQLPTELVRKVLRDVADALTAAHARGIVHRDVRPANVLWDEEDGSAHLTDFGIAALLVSLGEETGRLTQTGQMIGDPRYLSPEQLRDEDLTPLVDMYAFGVMGYELYSGEGPYAARTNTQLIAGHLSGEPRPLSSLRPDVDPAVADLLRRCLNRDPNHRPRAVDAARILRIGAGGVAAAPAAQSSDLSELLRRRVPQIVVISGGAGLSLIGLMGELVDRGTVDPIVFPLTLAFVVCGFVASMVVAWFHGERGPQKATLMEWTVLGVIGVIWVILSAWIVGGA
jgi:serine/threonine-protein kinase